MRHETTYTADKGRDAGKTYIIREMPATQGERWALRAFLALANSGLEIPDDTVAAGLPGLLSLGLRAVFKLKFEDAEPLLNEMMGCVKIQPDPANKALVRALVEEDIEEIGTRLALRKAVIELHSAPFLDAAPSSSPVVAASPQASSGIRMSRRPSAQ